MYDTPSTMRDTDQLDTTTADAIEADERTHDAALLAEDEDYPDFAPWDGSPEAYEAAERAYADWCAATGRR